MLKQLDEIVHVRGVGLWSMIATAGLILTESVTFVEDRFRLATSSPLIVAVIVCPVVQLDAPHEAVTAKALDMRSLLLIVQRARLVCAWNSS